jgi:exonuclease SbcC
LLDLDRRAEGHLADAEAELEARRTSHAAHAVRSHLVSGAPCPVCEQVVVSVPKRKRPAALRNAEQARAEARRIAAEAREAVTQATRRGAEARGRVAQLAERHAELGAALAEAPSADEVVRQLAHVDAITSAHAAARTREREARAAEQEAAGLVKTLEGQLRTHWSAHQAQRDEFVRAGLDPPAIGDDLVASWAALQNWAKQERTTQLGGAAAARKEQERLRAERAGAVARFLDRARLLAVQTSATDLAALRDAVLEHGRDARHELQRIEEAIEQAQKLEAEIVAAGEEREVAELLGSLLRSDRFEKWLLVEAIDALVRAASSILFALSAGGYSLRSSDDDEFVVVDHRNADEPRSVRTLSGGETFQASLALALALSDQLAELSAASGRKLEAIFLDEGFGTLDADALETVATTIEALGTSGRMVGIVTHVPALADRVPVRYRVTRTDRAASVVREDA